MAATLDVYRDWLRIETTERPLNHYQLLRLESFEDDAGKVRSRYRKLNAHVRKYATGDYAAESQDLLNELAKAMLCLTDAQRKLEYDASLGRRDTRAGRRRTLEEILILRKIVDSNQLQKARQYAEAIGLETRDALVQQKMAAADVVMQAYAESVGLPYLDPADIELDGNLLAQVPAQLARQNSCAPVMVDDGQLLVASPNPVRPQVEDELRLRLGMPVRSVLCTPASIHAIVQEYYSREAAQAERTATPDTTVTPEAGEKEPADKPKGLLARLFKK